MDGDAANIILICVVVGIVALFLGFGMGVSSVKQEIGKYGCDAVVKHWPEGRP